MTESPLGVAMITPFPPADALHGCGRGVASYAKNLVTSLADGNHHLRVLVLADRGTDGETKTRAAHDMLTAPTPSGARYQVRRCWREGMWYWLRLAGAVWRFRGMIDVVHIQHEYAQFGRSVAGALFPLLLLLIRLVRKPVVVTQHAVVVGKDLTDSFARQHFLRVSRPLLVAAFRLINKSVVRLARAVIVHQARDKNALLEDGSIPEDAIYVIEHGFERRTDHIDRATARAALELTSERVLLFFGYLARYKGLDLLLDAYHLLEKGDWRLIIAGGTPTHLRRNPVYARYYSRLRRSAAEDPSIVFTGFVPEAQIPLYLSAADVAIFPYPEMHASSGPFCLALSYNCPVLVSRPFGDYYGVPEELMFDAEPRELATMIARFFASEHPAALSRHWGALFRDRKDWPAVAARTAAVYNAVTSRVQVGS